MKFTIITLYENNLNTYFYLVLNITYPTIKIKQYSSLKNFISVMNKINKKIPTCFYVNELLYIV